MTSSTRKDQLLIAIVTQQRSGSKWMGSLIRNRYGAGSLGEIFNPDNKSILSFRTYLSRRNLGDLIGSDVSLMMDEYFDELRNYFGLFFSFDVMFNQVDWISFGWRQHQKPVYGYLKSRGDLVISLLRDKRDVFLSTKMLEITKKAHYSSLENHAKFSSELLERVSLSGKSRVDVDDYLTFSSQLERDRDLLRRSFNDYSRFIELNYEDLVSECGIGFDKIDSVIRDFGAGIGHDFPMGLQPFPDLVKPVTDYNAIFENAEEIFALE